MNDLPILCEPKLASTAAAIAAMGDYQAAVSTDLPFVQEAYAQLRLQLILQCGR